jgi:hypothetical protein
VRFEMDSRRLEAQLRRLISGSPGQLALDIVNRLVMTGAEYSKSLASVDSGELRGSIQMEPAAIVGDEAVGGWRATSDHGPYVEFGTGRPGAASTVANGQPRDPRAAGFTYTLQTVVQRKKAYTHRSGKIIPPRDYIIDGWVYYDTVRQRFVHTLGQPARPFMYPAKLYVEQQAGRIAADVLREAMRG